MLDEKRSERESFITEAVDKVRQELRRLASMALKFMADQNIFTASGTRCERKTLSFQIVYDVRALRIIVSNIKDCYTALGIVHNLWSPISKRVR